MNVKHFFLDISEINLKKNQNVLIETMGLLKNLRSLFVKEVDSSTVERLTEMLITYDVSHKTTSFLLDKVKKSSNITQDLQKEMEKITQNASGEINISGSPFVVFMFGVNGSGKTTTIVKLANIFQKQGKKVLVAACDTFRSAAADQLQLALSKINCHVVRSENEKTEPAAVAFVATQKVREENFDVLIIDTAGRLHTNTNLMNELSKLYKVTLKNLNNPPHVNIAIMDATIGQNSISQIKNFNEVVPISGVIITKLDTSAKGGALLSVIHEMKKSVYYTCTGSHINDITPFNPQAFVKEFLE